MGDWTGTVPSFPVGPLRSADMTTLADIVTALTAAMTTFTTTWASSGTQPAIVNGTKEGWYRRTGKDVFAVMKLVMGAGTTFGTGTYSLSLPVTAVGALRAVGACYIFDSGTANRSAIAMTSTTTTVQMVTSADGDVAATVPQTFASGDIILVTIKYEGA